MGMSVLEAVRRAQESVGNAPPQDLAAWIAANLGMAVKPVIVAVMLGSLLEKAQLERGRQRALELVEKLKAEQAAEKPKGKKRAKPADAGGGVPAAASVGRQRGWRVP
jgi:hypothetical protein